ncbi:TPA: polysaccharide biosynthesis C-terminal domain-containing protein [Vibrio parahaemolyticus]
MVKTLFKLFTSSYFGAALIFYSQLLSANYFSLEVYGRFISSFTLISLLVPFVGLGLDTYLYKYVSEGKKLTSLFGALTSYSILTLLMACLAYIFFVKENIAILMLTLLISQFLLSFTLVILQISREYNKYSALSMLQGLTRVLMILLFVNLLGWDDLEGLVKIYSLSACLIIIVCSIIIRKKIVKLEKSNMSFDLMFLVKMAAPYGVGTVAFLFYSQSVIYILSVLGESEFSAIYAVSYVFLNIAFMIPTIVYQKFLIPKLHILMNEGRDLSSLYSSGNVVMLILGLVFSFSMYLFSGVIIGLFFNEEYYQSVEILEFLSVIILFRFFSANSAAYLVTKNYMSLKNKLMIVVATINLLLAFILIPVYGLYGAVVTTIISEFVIAILYVLYAKRIIFNQLDFKEMFKFDLVGIKISKV